MNKQDKLYFSELSKNRSEIADALESPCICGVKNSVVEKYSDQAHFIYELLQNADDAKATNARFVLERDRLVFAHNGTRHFSISDPHPQNEAEDRIHGCLGDINAITSIGSSNKTEASIGKFGVGFKAVFQYTSTPHIYDPEFSFRIDRFIVPTLIDCDFSGRKEEETVFVFPFDHPERNAEEAYRDISDKLKNLKFPLLFLSELKEIKFEYNSISGLYKKEIKHTVSCGDTVAELICMTRYVDDDQDEENLWLFSRLDECQHRYSIGFFLNSDGHIKPVNEPAFCFFPTKEFTGLHFILHAPFLLTDSREGIRAGIPHNDSMVQKLADLAADAFEYLRDIGEKMSTPLIEDSVIVEEIIPVNQQNFSAISDKAKISFFPFYQTIKNKFETTALLPSSKGYASKENAYWASVPQLPQLFSNEQLAEITGNKNAKWVFTTLPRDEIKKNKQSRIYSYIDSLVRTNIDENEIIGGRSGRYSCTGKPESIKGINSDFIETQSLEWLHKFYKWISETKHRREFSASRTVFLDQDRKAVPALDKKGKHILFLPSEYMEGYTVVYPKLLENPETKKSLMDIGINQPSLKDQIYSKVLPKYEEGSDVDSDSMSSHFVRFFDYYLKCPHEEVDEFIDLIKNYKFVRYFENGIECRAKGNQLYFPTHDLKRYFSNKLKPRFVDYEGYLRLVGGEKEKYLKSFMVELGVKDLPSVYEIRKDDDCNYSECEYVVDGLLELIDRVSNLKDQALSEFLWKQLCIFLENKKLDSRVLNKEIKSRKSRRHKFKKEYIPSQTMIALKTKEWILNDRGEFLSSENITREHLFSAYDVDSDAAENLLSILEISEGYSEKDKDLENDSYLTDAQREKIAFANKLKEYGIENEEDLAEFQEFRRRKAATKKTRDGDSVEGRDKFEHLFDENVKSDENFPSEENQKVTVDIIKDIARRTKGKHSISEPEIPDEIKETDEDEFMPSAVDYSKKIELAKKKSAEEIDRIEYFGDLQNKAVQLTRDGKYLNP